ncbi:MAG: hypothetical protein ACJAZ0_001105 [Halioglobus sp.]|jgi:general secretion pathway protein M
MSRLKRYSASVMVVAISLLVPLLVVLYLALDFWLMRADYQSEIDNLQPRVSRMLGLLESEQQLQVAADRLGSQVAGLVYPASENAATISAALQKNIREIMTDAGLSVTNSRILPLIQDDQFGRVGLVLTVIGGLDALDAALSELSNHTPLLLIDSLNIKPRRMTRSRDSNGDQSMTATLQLLTLRST